jgi:hypothetical protein
MANRHPTGSFQANVSIRHTVADAAGSSVWAIHVPSASKKKLYLRRFNFVMEFDGTAAAATSLGYELIRHSGAVDPTSGTTVPRIGKKGARYTSVIADANIQQKSGVLTFAPTFDGGPFHVTRLPASVTNGVLVDDLKFSQAGQDPMGNIEQLHEFRPDEGWAIRLHLIAIIGLNLSGSFEWDEVTI